MICYVIRYRYPINSNKRSEAAQSQSNYNVPEEAGPQFFNLDDEYPDSEVIYSTTRGGSPLYRKRTRERFLEEVVPSRLLQATPRSEVKKSYLEVTESPYDLAALSQLYEDKDKNYATDDPNSLELFRITLETLQRRKMEENMREEQLRMEEAELLQDLVNKATAEYVRENDDMDYNDMLRNKNIRNKRSTRITSIRSEQDLVNGTSTNGRRIKIPMKVSEAEYHAILSKDRKKRAYGSPSRYQSENFNSAMLNRRSQEDVDDFLTREYFKTIARSVGGDKRKRMAYAQFEKRDGSIDAFLDNPEMLQYMMDKLKGMS